MLMVKNKYLVSFKKALKNKSETLNYVKDFSIEIILYGVMLGLIAFYFLEIPLTLHSVIAFGLVKYFVTEEFPLFLQKLRVGIQ